MPAFCGAPLFHDCRLSARIAVLALSLAVAVQPFGTSGFGNDACSSSMSHCLSRLPLVALTRATSAGVTKPPRLPKLLRTYEATDATHSSVFDPIGIITSV